MKVNQENAQIKQWSLNLMKVLSCRVMLFVLFTLLMVACLPALDVTASEVEQRINRELQPGDQAEKIEAYFKKEGIPAAYDSFRSRYQSSLRHPDSHYHVITIYVYVDTERNFIKAEAHDSYTFL